MTSIPIYFALICFLMINCNALRFNIDHELYENEGDSLDDEQCAALCKQRFGPDRNDINAAYTKDALNVYLMGQKIHGANAMTFQILKYGYAKDALNVYYMGKKVDGASAVTFQILTRAYAKDALSVYYMGKKVDGASAKTFQVLNRAYAKDALSVYYMGEKMQGASPSTFTMNISG